MLRKWLKRFAWLIAGLVLLGTAILLLLPFWLPWVLRPALGAAGVEFAEYERISHGRFALSELRYTSEAVRVEGKRMEVFLPLSWLVARRQSEPPLDFVFIKDWRLEIEPGAAEPDEKPDERETEISVYEVVAQIESIVPHVVSWLPRATLSQGAVALGDREVLVKSVEWRQGHVTAIVADPVLEQEVLFTADVTGGLPYRFAGSLQPFPLEVDVHLLALEDGLAVRSDIVLMGNRLTASADFQREGYLPNRALFRSEEFVLPVNYFEIPGFHAIRGVVALDWQAGEYQLNLDGSADPVEGEERLPPVSVRVAVGGDLESATVETLTVTSPWLTAQLSDPVQMDYEGNLLSGESVFTIEADLGAQPFVEAEGRLSGRGDVWREGEELTWPLVRFALDARDVASHGVEVDRWTVRGALEWPLLRLEQTVLEGGEGTRVAGAGGWNFENNILQETTLAGVVRGADFRVHLPDDVNVSSAEFSLAASGPIDQIRHGGTMEVLELATPWINTLGVEMQWEGFGMEDLTGSFAAKAGGSELAARFGVRMNSDLRTVVDLETLSLNKAGETVLQAAGPARATVIPGEAGVGSAQIEGLHWLADEGEVKADAKIAWPQSGRFDLLVRGFDPAWVEDFYKIETGVVEAGFIGLEGEWNEGPLHFAARADVGVTLADGERVRVDAELSGDGRGIRIDSLRARDARTDLAVAEGFFPMILYPAGEDTVVFLDDEPVGITAETKPGASFWELMGELTGFHLEEPAVRFEMAGTPRQPEGRLTANLKSLQWPERDEGPPLPALENLRVDLVFNEERIDLQRAELAVEGQKVEGAGSLAMGSNAWQALREREYPDWRQAEGRLRVENASLASVARFFPTVLTPQGILNLDVRARPGLELEGTLAIDDVATRPLMPLGSLQEGTARVRFHGRTAEIERVSGLLGGETVTISGTVDLPIERDMAFDLSLRGRKLPLAREPGMIIRSDMDLRLASRPGNVPLISGRLDLRESFYLAQLRLMPGASVASPARRPPFFSVEAEPFNLWQLDLDIQGQEFLNVRGGLFRGVLSAGFHLTGTLEEPRAIGDITIESGRIRFPFTTMSITQGVVSLPRENPFMPQLFVLAQSTTFGYDLQIEVAGTAEAPVITFSSSPPLTSEQVLLMVTAGELPQDQQMFTAQQRATRFAVYLGRNLLYQITGDESDGERLMITSGEHVSEQGRETFGIEYRLSNRWSAVGEYDRFDEYNAGLKVRIFTR